MTVVYPEALDSGRLSAGRRLERCPHLFLKVNKEGVVGAAPGRRKRRASAGCMCHLPKPSDYAGLRYRDVAL